MKLIDVVRKAAASLLVWGVASFNYAVFAQDTSTRITGKSIVIRPIT